MRINGREIALPRTMQVGDKFAARRIETGEAMVKYGTTFGHAAADIAPGEPVTPQNLSEGA